jgi:hypothetical protein
MNIAIKNNRNLLSKRNRLAKRLGGFNANKKTEYNLPIATTKQLKDIGKRLKNDGKIRMIKVVLLTLFLFMGLVYVWVCIADVMVQFVTY